MAGMNVPMNRSAGRRFSDTAIRAPRLVMSWEDWLTLAAVFICFLSVAVSIDQARWVPGMPNTVWTLLGGLLIGMVAARLRVSSVIVQPIALLLGVAVVVLVVQTYAEGFTLSERISDFQARMNEWYQVVRDGDISNDNLPFITLVHGISFMTAYLGAYSIYRWHNPWVAVLPSATVILANISFLKGQPSGAFVFFLFGAILLVARMHLQRSQAKWQRQGIEYPDLISLSAIQLTVVLTLGLIVLAWAVPLGAQAQAVEGVYDGVVSPFTGNSETFNRLFHNIDSRKGARLHSFGSTLPIQGHVKLGTKSLYEIKSGDAGLIRATSYDLYTGTGWKTGERDSRRADGGALAAPTNLEKYEGRTVAILNVTVLDHENTILSAGIPLATNKEATVASPAGFAGDIEQLRPRRGLEAGDTYNSIGSQSTATAEQLRASGNAYPQWVKDRYLQLPKNLPQRVRDESRSVATGARNPYDQASAVEAYLRTFPYDLAVESAPPGHDTVDYLLFDLKRGYFDYQATAMVVMLRTLGIPARITTGYVLDPDSVNETTYTVRKSDAYTWVEVFFPKYGWVNFNPTQDRPGGGAESSFGTAGGAQTNIDPQDLEDLLAGQIPLDDTGLGAIDTALKEQPIEHGSFPWMVVWLPALALALIAALLLGGRLSWNWGLGALDQRSRAWAKAQRLAGWAGLGAKPAETPREWSRRVGETVQRPAEAATLASAYEESRYGRPDLQRVGDTEAVGSYRQLRNSLLRKVLRLRPGGGRRGKRRRG